MFSATVPIIHELPALSTAMFAKLDSHCRANERAQLNCTWAFALESKSVSVNARSRGCFISVSLIHIESTVNIL